MGLVLNSGYTFGTKKQTDTTEEKITETIVHTEKKSNYHIIEETLDMMFPDNKKEDEKEKKARGVMAPIVNKITENKTPVISLLNSIQLFFYKHNISGAIISLIAAIVLLLNHVFLQNLMAIGNNRFFLEVRRYQDTRIDKVLYPYKTKRIPHLALIIFLKEIYLFLWNLTIIGGFIKYYEYAPIPYILAENPNISRKDAFKLAKEMMKGHKFELFKLELSLIGWQLLSAITFGLSDVVVFDAYKKCIETEFYMNIRNENYNRWKDLLPDTNLNIPESIEGSYPEPQTTKRKQKKKEVYYDKSYSITSYILFFFTFAFIGWLWEVMLHLVTDGKFVNRGVMYGPWLPIYGFGGILILFFLKPFRKQKSIYFVAAVVLAGVLEYTTSWALEVIKNMKWWDYTGYFLNLNGRICLEGLIVFGLGGCALTYLVAPNLDLLYDFIKPKIKIVICTILLIVYGTDMIYSFQHPNSGEGITNYTS